ncbi:hypothetical protein CN958_27535 [Bacillus cereus]|uniref:Uncharacterized protein n=1 Tax=Bacillus cereus TaxID=1396 RepID=A0A2B9DKK9_BACCE|nr:hypothetical protein CN958_27535 [Bacillus cereus]
MIGNGQLKVFRTINLGGNEKWEQSCAKYVKEQSDILKMRKRQYFTENVVQIVTVLVETMRKLNHI